MRGVTSVQSYRNDNCTTYLCGIYMTIILYYFSDGRQQSGRYQITAFLPTETLSTVSRSPCKVEWTALFILHHYPHLCINYPRNTHTTTITAHINININIKLLNMLTTRLCTTATFQPCKPAIVLYNLVGHWGFMIWCFILVPRMVSINGLLFSFLLASL